MSVGRSALTGILLFVTHCSLQAQDESDLSHFRTFFAEKYTEPLEKSLHDAGEKLEQAREINDAKKEASALRELGLVHLNRVPDHEKALDLFISSLAIEDSLNLDAGKVLTYIAISRVFEAVGDYHKSAHFLEQALSVNKERRHINAVAMILNSLGRVNALRGRMEDASENYQQVLRYRNDIDRQFEAEALFNLGHLLTLQGKYSPALENHKKALAVTRALRDRHSEATSLSEIGTLYSLMKDNKKSLENHLVALDIRKTLMDKRGIAESFNNIGSLSLRQGDAENGITNGLLALEHAREAQDHEQIFKSYDLLSRAYKSLGDYSNALLNMERGIAINDLIQSERQERQLLETQNRYVLEKKDSKIQGLEALRIEREREITAQKQFRNVLYLVVVLVLSIAGLLFILYLVKRRSNRILKVAQQEVRTQNEKLHDLNQTKDKFFSIISHDLKGPLNSLTSFSRLLIDHTDSLTKDEIRFLASDLDKSVKNLLTLLENLLEWARSQTGNIDFAAEEFNLNELLLANKSLLGSQAKDKQIELIIAPAADVIVRLHKQSINTVVRNLISNAIKFTPEGGTIRMGLRTETSTLTVFVEDNGVGMSKEVMSRLFQIGSKHSTTGTASEKGTGLGLILCREFVEKNGGKIAVDSAPGKGSTFKFSFPISICMKPAPPKKEPVPF